MHISGRTIPFPTFNEYAEGARVYQDIAEAADAILVSQNTTIPAIRTRPCARVFRSTDSASTPHNIWLQVGFPSTDKDNASLVVPDTITTGATTHPALWEVHSHIFVQAVTTDDLGQPRLLELRASWTDPVTGRVDTEIARHKLWSANTGGQLLQVETVFRTIAPTTFAVWFLPSNPSGGAMKVLGGTGNAYLAAIRVGSIP